MTPKAYKAWAMTKDTETYEVVSERLAENDEMCRLLHAAVGLAGESGELLDTVKKTVFYGKPLDKVNIKEEIGDAMWYMALALHSIGSSFEEVMALNRTKLDTRYPSGFTEKHAIQRLDKQT